MTNGTLATLWVAQAEEPIRRCIERPKPAGRTLSFFAGIVALAAMVAAFVW